MANASSRGEKRKSCCPSRSRRESTAVPMQHASRPAPEAHADSLAQHLAEKIEVRGAERALDAEVPDALEDGGRHRVGERQAPDEESKGADPKQERGEEGGRLSQEAAQLAGNRDVEAGHRRLNASGQSVRV